jgi:transcription antitermination factor NusG
MLMDLNRNAALAQLATDQAARSLSRRTRSEAAKVFYILRVHPNHELKAARQLSTAGVECYIPQITEKLKTACKRTAERQVPLFPGAMFVPDFAADLAWLKSIASSIGGFVKYTDGALKVSICWMDRIRNFEARQQARAGHRRFAIGQKVRVTDGPYEMWEGRIERLDRNYRLRVLIEAITREVAVELDEDQVEAV